MHQKYSQCFQKLYFPFCILNMVGEKDSRAASFLQLTRGLLFHYVSRLSISIYALALGCCRLTGIERGCVYITYDSIFYWIQVQTGV